MSEPKQFGDMGEGSGGGNQRKGSDATKSCEFAPAALSLARQVIGLHELNKDGVSGQREPAEVTLARALLACTPSSRVDGWKLVPAEPTPNMIGAAHSSFNAVPDAGKFDPARHYRAMLNAAPVAPSSTARSESGESFLGELDYRELLSECSALLEAMTSRFTTWAEVKVLRQKIESMLDGRKSAPSATRRTTPACHEIDGNCPDYDKCCNAGRCLHTPPEERHG
jgi:hypothetical protein